MIIITYSLILDISQKLPRFNNIFDYNNQLYREIKNEKVNALEFGYSYRSSIFSGKPKFLFYRVEK